MPQLKSDAVSEPKPVASPPDGAFPHPPVMPAAMSLPFGELSWENFERLCYRLAGRSAVVEAVARYGRQGQAQQGIDVYARKTNGRYEVWQAKRYRTFSATQVRKAVHTFLAGTWVGKSDKLVIAVQANLDDVKVQDEIEKQVAILRSRKIALVVLGGDALADQVRPHQDLVLSFFSRGWLHAFYGEAVDASIANRLDGEEFARVRAQVARLYTARFSDLDQGIIASRFAGPSERHRPIALLDRYAMTDVYVRDTAGDPTRGPEREIRPSSDTSAMGERPTIIRAGREEVRRIAVGDWLSDADQIAVVADAGVGKSTLLRCIALDLLGSQAIFPALGARWGDRLPIIVPFAKWARATAEKGGEIGLKELVASTLQPLLTVDLVALINRAIDENRIVLIVDGLDEWSAEQAARVALQTLLTYVEVHQIPTVASGRPLGLRKIGTLPQSWKTAELAPLSMAQQRQLAHTWFDHLLRGRQGQGEVSSTVSPWQAERFLKELQVDRALGELAETPLLFVGLLALAVRDVALPRNRAQALQSLIRLLLEIHPESRATAAGDVVPRFAVASAPELRQTALAALAFASRRDGGDAGYSRALARTAVREHLLGTNGYDVQRAEAVADEVLGVNAETVGLLVEKGPAEVGFAHASLEEFLSALHIHSWRFSDLLAFVTENAGDPRWRNVLRNVVAINARTSEVDDIVAAIEAADLDVLGAINRRHLLAEITFSPSAMGSGTARRLADQTFYIIEGLGPEVEKIALLRLALNGLSDPALETTLEGRVRRWAPRRLQYSQNLYRALHGWAADDTLLAILLTGLTDEDRAGARAAAQTLATKFKGQPEVGARLRKMIAGTSSIGVVAAVLEALALGWPGPIMGTLVQMARDSRSPLLRAVAIWARVVAKMHDATDLRDCLQMVGSHSPLDYTERDIAREALFAGWPDNDQVVADAIKTLGHGPSPRDTIDRDLAVNYLLNSKPGRAAVETWILDELKREHPFVLLGGGSWGSLVKFMESSALIRERVIEVVASGARKYRQREAWEVIAQVRDTRLRDHAIEAVRSAESIGRYWSLLPLVEGWSDDPVAQAVFDEVVALEDGEMNMLVALLPRLYADPAEARARLLRIATGVPKARFDLIAGALASLGVDGHDAEAVDALLPHVTTPSRSFASPDVVFALFAESPKIRDTAVARLQQSEPPLAAIARGLADDPTVRAHVADLVLAAPRALRAAITAACGTSGDRHPALSELLAKYDDEVDFQLKVQLAIDFYKLKYATGSTEGLVERLLAEAYRTGPDFEEARATAFAGLVALHSAGTILEGEGGERDINLGSYYRGGVSSALCGLVVENWDELKTALGDHFAEHRLKTLDGSAWTALARFIGSRPSVRQDFLAWCEASDQIGLSALRALADIAPGSDILRQHALKIIDRSEPSDSSNALPILLLAAEILRAQFLSAAHVERVRQIFADRRDLYAALVLAIIAPDDTLLQDRRITALEVGDEHSDWHAAIEFAARLEPSEMVVEVIHHLAERRVHPHWDQSLPLHALTDRIMRDSNTRALLRGSLNTSLSPSAFCASATLLAASGALDAAGWDLCAEKLLQEQASQNVPVAVLDINTDQIRPLSHVLTDLFQTRSSL